MIILPNKLPVRKLEEDYSYYDEAIKDIKEIHAELFNNDFNQYLSEGYINEANIPEKLKSVINKFKESINKSADTFVKRNNEFLKKFKAQKTENEILLDKFTMSDSFDMNVVKYYIVDEIPDLYTIDEYKSEVSKKFVVNIDEVKNGTLLRKVEDKIRYIHHEVDILRGYILNMNRGVTKKDFKDECKKCFTVNHDYEKRITKITPNVINNYIYNLALYDEYSKYVEDTRNKINKIYNDMIYAELFEDMDNIVKIINNDDVKVSNIADSRTKAKLKEYGKIVSSSITDLIDSHILAFNIKLECIEEDRKQGEAIIAKAKKQVGM